MSDKNMMELIPKLTPWMAEWVKWAAVPDGRAWRTMSVTDPRVMLASRARIAKTIRGQNYKVFPSHSKLDAEVELLLTWLEEGEN